mmetsp:Transcript_32984/g.48375  ORF Transcript_32984/g.48375 Transcript_32984/m.48375 type:complete len:433 (+) Transcript_32984:65-1363(+)
MESTTSPPTTSSTDNDRGGNASDFLGMFNSPPSSNGDNQFLAMFQTNGRSEGGGQQSRAFDLNDFPSLGGGASGANPTVSGGTNHSGGGGGFAEALRQQAQMQQQMQAQGNNAKFNMATEDFPALPGAPAPGSLGGGDLLGTSTDGNGGARDISGSTSFGGGVSSVQPNSQGSNNSNPLGLSSGISGNGMYNELETSSSSLRGLGGVVSMVGGGELGGSGNIGLQTGAPSASLSQQRTPTSASTTSTVGGGGSALSGDYGLLGLLGVIRMSDADRNALALGSDLTLLGLNLNSSEHLYSTFASPWSDSPTTREPQYQLPMCYYMQPPALKTGHLSKFQLETLFYIFYALPKDVLQAYAAQELYSREWRYHVDLKLWFKRASPADGVPNANGTQYIYFDINSWERRLFNGNLHQNITNGFLSEEDVRVKFPSS